MMKIIVSPTKTMKRKRFTSKKSSPMFINKSREIRSYMTSLSKNQLKKIMKTSDSLTEQVFQYYQSRNESIQAINLYEGASFKAMKLEQWKEKDFDYAQKCVWILSAMYGVLRPFDMINEYRLDYTMSIDRNLYDFWHHEIQKLVENQDFIINLASREFSKQFPNNKLINIHFLNSKGINISSRAKKARGDMLNYIICNRINNIDQLKQYDRLNYSFSPTKSNELNLYFIQNKD